MQSNPRWDGQREICGVKGIQALCRSEGGLRNQRRKGALVRIIAHSHFPRGKLRLLVRTNMIPLRVVFQFYAPGRQALQPAHRVERRLQENERGSASS